MCYMNTEKFYLVNSLIFSILNSLGKFYGKNFT